MRNSTPVAASRLPKGFSMQSEAQSQSSSKIVSNEPVFGGQAARRKSHAVDVRWGGQLVTIAASAYMTSVLVIAVGERGVVYATVIMTALIEVPVLGFQIAPERTAATVVRLRGWLAENGGRVGANVAIVLGAILVARGILTLHT